MERNPFLISGYVSPDYFCDRDIESETILDAVNNGRNMTIFSPRRMGKTGVIKHVFYKAKKEKLFIPVYVDILATTSLKEFTETLGKAVLSTLAKNETALRKILRSLASLRPKISVDTMTGEPGVTFTVDNAKDAETSLETIFDYVRKQDKKVVVAIDEFQQITYYPEKNVEAFLRTQIQQSSNISTIFSGSRKHVLAGIFVSPDRPFYNSTQILELKKIPEDSYNRFISDKFTQRGKSITGDSIKDIFRLTELHTFYVQFLCNRLFSLSKKVEKEQVDNVLRMIINENEPVYASYLNFMTALQFRVLRAIAINKGVENPTSMNFLDTYSLGAASSVSQTIKSLEDKEMLSYSEKLYSLNDKFFAQWLIRK